MALRELFAQQNFEDQSSFGWTNDSGGALDASFSITAPGLNSSGYKLQGTSSGSNHFAQLPINTILTSGTVDISLRVRTHGENTTRLLSLGTKDTSTGVAGIQAYVRFNTDGSIEGINGSGVWQDMTTWAANTEYTVRIVVYLDGSHTWDGYIDGVLYADGWTWRDIASAGVKNFFWNKTPGGTPTGYAAIDEISIEPITATALTSGYQAQEVGTKCDYSPGEQITTKPQKLHWYSDGAWWAVLHDGVSGWYIYRLDQANMAWRSRPTRISTDGTFRMDVYHDGTNAYVAGAHATQNKLWKLAYNAGTDAWDISASSNVGGAVTDVYVDADHANFHNVSIVGDSSSRVWMFWIASADPNGTVACEARSKSDLSLVTSSNQTLDTVLLDDLLTAVAFNDGTASVGIIYSDQGASKILFLHRHDGDGVTTWQTVEEVCSTTNEADDHVDIVANPSNGKLYACWKTSYDTVGMNNCEYSWRNTSGVWSAVSGPWTGTAYTRPRLAYDSTNDTVYVFATTSSNIVYKSKLAESGSWSSDVSAIDGTTTLNDVSSLHGNVTGSTDLVFLAFGADDYLYYNLVAIADAASGTKDLPSGVGLKQTATGLALPSGVALNVEPLRVKKIYTGEVTGWSTTSLDVDIGATVDWSKSIRFFTMASALGTAQQANVGLRAVNNYQIQFFKPQAVLNDYIRWTVVEFLSGISVQHVAITGITTGLSGSQTLVTPVPQGKGFILANWGLRPSANPTTWNYDDFFRVQLGGLSGGNYTNIEWSRGGAYTFTTDLYVQVVTFKDSSAVQMWSQTTTSGGLSYNFALSPSVAKNRLLTLYTKKQSTTSYAAALDDGWIAAPNDDLVTQINLHRTQGRGVWLLQINAIVFADATVQHQQIIHPAGTATLTADLATPVKVDRSIVIAQYNDFTPACHSAQGYVADDRKYQAATAELLTVVDGKYTQVRVRKMTGSPVGISIGYYLHIIEFAPTEWTLDLPSGVALTVDSATGEKDVASGMKLLTSPAGSALASGASLKQTPAGSALASGMRLSQDAGSALASGSRILDTIDGPALPSGMSLLTATSSKDLAAGARLITLYLQKILSTGARLALGDSTKDLPSGVEILVGTVANKDLASGARLLLAGELALPSGAYLPANSYFIASGAKIANLGTKDLATGARITTDTIPSGESGAGAEKHWFDGLPFRGVDVAGVDQGTVTWWEDGHPTLPLLPAEIEILLPYSASWRYSYDNSDQFAAGFYQDTFQGHLAWSSGQGIHGFGDLTGLPAEAAIRTTLTQPADNRSLYLRRDVFIEDVTQLQSLRISAIRDDGFVLWVNGVEVARSSNVSDPISHGMVVSAGGEGTEDVVTLTGPQLAPFRTGWNSISMMGLQAGAASTDLGIGLKIEANVSAAGLDLETGARIAVLGSLDLASGAAIQAQAPSIDLPAGLSLKTTGGPALGSGVRITSALGPAIASGARIQTTGGPGALATGAKVRTAPAGSALPAGARLIWTAGPSLPAGAALLAGGTKDLPSGVTIGGTPQKDLLTGVGLRVIYSGPLNLSSGVRVVATLGAALASGVKILLAAGAALASGARLLLAPTKDLATGVRLLTAPTGKALATGAKILTAPAGKALATGVLLAGEGGAAAISSGARIRWEAGPAISSGVRLLTAPAGKALPSGVILRTGQLKDIPSGARLIETLTRALPSGALIALVSDGLDLSTGARIRQDGSYGLSTGVFLEGQITTDIVDDVVEFARLDSQEVGFPRPDRDAVEFARVDSDELRIDVDEV
jgi:hypothetical protein